MADSVNFPDVLGYVTDGERLNLDIIHVAATCLPMTVKAGKVFRLVVIVQNMVDSPISMTIKLDLPPDAAGKKNKFSAKTQRIEIGLQPAEVGMVLLPIGSMGDTASGAVKFPISISDVKAERRGGVIRAPEGGSALYADGLTSEKRRLLDNFAKQSFVGGKKAILGGSATLTPSVTFYMNGLTENTDSKAEYRTLWKAADMRENPLNVLDRFKAEMTQYALVSLDRTQLLGSLTKKTTTRFKQAGYELTDVEAKLIGRALTNVLEYACTGKLSYGRTYPPLPAYQVLPLIQRPPREKPVIKLRWLVALLNAMVEDIRVSKNVWRLTLLDPFYDALLRDTLTWGLNVVEAATGLELGTPAELEQHADQWFEKFQLVVNGEFDAEPLRMEDVYLPFVIAGIAVYDKIALPDEDIKAIHPLFRGMLRKRADERTDDNAPLFDITARMLSEIVGDDSIIHSVNARASSNSRTYQIPYSNGKRKTHESDIKAIRDFFERPVSEMWVHDPYLLDYERLHNRLGAYIQMAAAKGALKAIYVQTRDAQTQGKDAQEQLLAITDLKKQFPTIHLDIKHQGIEHDRWIIITRPDGSKARMIIGVGLDFIRADGSVKKTTITIEEL